MRILFLVHTFPCLSETFILQQVTGLIDLGHDVRIVAESRPESPAEIGEVGALALYRLQERTTYVDIPGNYWVRFLKGTMLALASLLHRPGETLWCGNFFRWGRDAWSFRLLFTARAIRQARPVDVFHCHFGPLGMLGVKLKVCGVVPNVIASMHGYDMSLYVREHSEKIYRDLVREADCLLPVTQLWQTKLRQMGADPQNLRHLRMGVDTEALRFGLAHSEESGRILMVGRLVEKKGTADGIRAFQEIAARRPHVELRIVGDGPLRPALSALIAELGLDQRVQLRGSRSHAEVLDELRHAAILLCPSVTAADGDMEGLPVVLMEAMALGVPVVATRHSGIPELVQDGQTGLTAEEHDVAGLARHLETLLAHPMTGAAMAKRARVFVEENHNNSTLCRELQKIYQDVRERRLKPATRAMSALTTDTM